MEFEWDEAKRRANVAKHGIDFVRAQELFDGRPVITRSSSRAGEDRWLTTGFALAPDHGGLDAARRPHPPDLGEECTG